MKLNKKKIENIKNAMGLTWEDVASKGKLKTRQAAYFKWRNGSALQAEFFAKIFNIDPKDLIK